MMTRLYRESLTVADVETLLANPTAFRAFLNERDLQAGWCGRSGYPQACPIHQFLNESGLDGAWINVGKQDVEFMAQLKPHKAGLASIPLPAWTQAFIARVDVRYPLQRVLASECLQILAEIEVAA